MINLKTRVLRDPPRSFIDLLYDMNQGHRPITRLFASLAFVAACTWFGFHFRLNLATTGFLYLVLVVATAMSAGFWVATATSVVAALCLNYFFAPPLFSFLISDPANWVALGVFEVTALVISRLSNLAENRTAEAMRERSDTEKLYQLSLRIFLLDRSLDPAKMLSAVIRERFELKAVVLFDAASGNIYSAGDATSIHVDMARRAYLRDSSEFDPKLQSWCCPVRVDRRPRGGLALCGPAVRPLIAAALASLCAIAFERFRSLQRESRAEAARKTEQLRGAVLDSLAHQIKTPIATIWAASSGLLHLGGLSATQELLVTALDEQSKKLSDIASQLVHTARLDGAMLAPRRELLMLSDVVDDTIQPLQPLQSDSRLRISYPATEMPVLGDRKLISEALGQLIDNALKYSVPGTPIEIRVETCNANATLSVRNEGSEIPSSERDRIFERFYRSNHSQRGPSGSGLGLSIVKRIVEAHGGRVWTESHAGITLFSIALPLASPDEIPPPCTRRVEPDGK